MAESEPTVVDRPGVEPRPTAAGSRSDGTAVDHEAVAPPSSVMASALSLQSGSKAPSFTATVAEQAMTAVEVQRMRGLITGIAASSAFTALIPLLLGGDAFAARVHAIALGCSAVQSALIALWFRNPKHYKPRLALYAILSQAVVLITGFYFWGVFSAYGALVPLTIYIAVGSATRTEAVLGLALCVGSQTAFALLLVFGVISPRGLVEPVPGRVDVKTELIAIALLQAITIGAAVAGRAAKRDATRALEAHNQALLDLARREAQLAEAHADARAAREAGVGGAGRFTDQQLDDFQIGEVLGRGAMGEVYAAKTPGNNPAAVKILAPHLLRDQTARERFLRESEIISAISSPHVVKVLAVAPKDALIPYIAMERLQGTDLAQTLKKQALLPLTEIEEIVVHVATGLDAAHKAGVIHRDLKPSNIFATGEASGRVWKLLDFGASKWHDGEGTLKRAQISEQLEAVIAVALAKSPMHRFSTAGDLAAAFSAAAAGKLDRTIRKRAEAVLADLPWDTWKRG
jgi:tRNA A-37 threonylcarbamoyl transferase component Bud32